MALAEETCGPDDYGPTSIKKFCVHGFELSDDATLVLRLRFGKPSFLGDLESLTTKKACVFTSSSTIKSMTPDSPILKPGETFLVDKEQCVLKSLTPLKE